MTYETIRMNRGPVLEIWIQDARYALRLLRSRLYCVSAVDPMVAPRAD